jgi:uncharacterized peroxidase-related enzyme
MPRIHVIQPAEAEGQLKEIYDDLLQKRGKLAEVHKIQSLNPETIVRHMDLYMSVMYAHSPLSRPQREMIAVVVSVTNQCVYCQVHHNEALLNYWKDQARVEKLKSNFRDIDLSEKDVLLCELAQVLTADPSSGKVGTIIDTLKNKGTTDRELLDAHLVIAYFNFVNRLVLGLGINLEEDKGTGYKY